MRDVFPLICQRYKRIRETPGKEERGRGEETGVREGNDQSILYTNMKMS
jgi:hypothetical protein